jgi:hypothetical protein
MSSNSIRRRMGVLLLAVGCSSIMTGCIANTEVGEDEVLGEAEQALEGPSFQKTWYKGDPGVIDLAPVADYWCTLTGVSGRLRGLGEEIYVSANDGLTPMWQLRGKSGTADTTGTATCYRRDAFVGAGSANLVSIEYQLQASGHPYCDEWDFPWNCPVETDEIERTTPLWQGDAVAMLTGIAGEFRGPGEFVEVRQASNGSSVTQLAARTRVNGDHVRARAHEFFVGTPHGQKAARFVGPGGTGSAGWAGQYEAGDVNGSQTKLMAKRSDAFCYLTYVSGNFDHVQNSVAIVKDGDNWSLKVNSPGGKKVTARARCMLLDQR